MGKPYCHLVNKMSNPTTKSIFNGGYKSAIGGAELQLENSNGQEDGHRKISMEIIIVTSANMQVIEL